MSESIEFGVMILFFGFVILKSLPWAAKQIYLAGVEMRNLCDLFPDEIKATKEKYFVPADVTVEAINAENYDLR